MGPAVISTFTVMMRAAIFSSQAWKGLCVSVPPQLVRVAWEESQHTAFSPSVELR